MTVEEEKKLFAEFYMAKLFLKDQEFDVTEDILILTSDSDKVLRAEQEKEPQDNDYAVNIRRDCRSVLKYTQIVLIILINLLQDHKGRL